LAIVSLTYGGTWSITTRRVTFCQPGSAFKLEADSFPALFDGCEAMALRSVQQQLCLLGWIKVERPDTNVQYYFGVERLVLAAQRLLYLKTPWLSQLVNMRS